MEPPLVCAAGQHPDVLQLAQRFHRLPRQALRRRAPRGGERARVGRGRLLRPALYVCALALGRRVGGARGGDGEGDGGVDAGGPHEQAVRHRRGGGGHERGAAPAGRRGGHRCGSAPARGRGGGARDCGQGAVGGAEDAPRGRGREGARREGAEGADGALQAAQVAAALAAPQAHLLVPRAGHDRVRGANRQGARCEGVGRRAHGCRPAGARGGERGAAEG
mmetsp:Transcript_15148/g.45084  ORF Transcript_15148/g.45084 Transcript_15148/m.45084 type:complete len:221 (+) Transcript_15148:144-806(+)